MRRLAGIHTGIVIKKYPYKNKVALLDKTLGRIDGVLFVKKEISLGALLHYSLDERGGVYFVNTCEVIDVPLLLGKHDLYFLHHVFEVCYYSIPIGTVESAVFDALVFLYARFSILWTMDEKKIFIFRLLVSIGFYAEHSFLHKPVIIDLYTMPIDKVFDGTIHLDCVQEIHDWICFNLAEHPYSDQFKTMSFLYTK